MLEVIKENKPKGRVAAKEQGKSLDKRTITMLLISGCDNNNNI